jgi:(p)ppGpp synthase/HD superfamily hydrolase
MEIYAPLTDRMGMNRIRDELEDISFKVLNPEARELITKRLNVKEVNRKDTFKKFQKNLLGIKRKWY